MNNQKVLDQRWELTEKTLKQYYKKFQWVYRDIGDEILEVCNGLLINRDILNKNISNSIKRRYFNKIFEWKKQGLYEGYFKYLIESTTRYTYANILKILVYGIYMSSFQRQNTLSNQVFKLVGQDGFKQGQNDLHLENGNIGWKTIESFLFLNAINMSYKDYLQSLLLTAAQETNFAVLSSINQNEIIDYNYLAPYMLKHCCRIIKANNSKYSGVLADTSRAVLNKAYLYAGEDRNNTVEFFAEEDINTTRMCRSLDGQLFDTKGYNYYKRYSDNDKRVVDYVTYGLKVGENLPPIDNHFHWCRSTISFNFRSSIENGIAFRNYVIHNKKIIEIDGHKLLPNSNQNGEIVTAYWYKQNFGQDVIILPELQNELNYKNPDYLINGERWDSKQLTGHSTSLIGNIINRHQATSYILDITNCPLSLQELERQINRLYANKDKSWLNTIILKKENEVVMVYKRN